MSIINILYGNNFLDQEEFKPLIRYGKIIPDYFVSYDGRIYSKKSNKFLTLINKPRFNAGGSQVLTCLKFDVYIPENLFDDFVFRRNYEGGSQKMTISVHRAVAETWKKIDEYPPIPKKDWDICPESAKQWIRDTALVDHIDADPSNNRGDNLMWVVPKDNEPNRKKYKQEI